MFKTFSSFISGFFVSFVLVLSMLTPIFHRFEPLELNTIGVETKKLLPLGNSSGNVPIPEPALSGFFMDAYNTTKINVTVNQSHFCFSNNYINESLMHIDVFVPEELQDDLGYVTPCDSNLMVCQGENGYFHILNDWTNEYSDRFYIETDYLFGDETIGDVNITLWDYPVVYVINDVVEYNDGNYRVIQNHTSQSNWKPDSTPSLYENYVPHDVPVGFGNNRINQNITVNYSSGNSGIGDLLNTIVELDDSHSIRINVSSYYKYFILNYTYYYNGNITGQFEDVYIDDDVELLYVDYQINKYDDPLNPGIVDRAMMRYDNMYGENNSVNVTIAYPENKTFLGMNKGVEVTPHLYDTVNTTAHDLGYTDTLLDSTNGYTIRSFSVPILNDSIIPIWFKISSSYGEYNNLRMWITGSFAGGDGTSGDPYQIETWAQLDETRDNLSASYILNNNLDKDDTGYDTYASSSANSGSGWNPIDDGFTGTFDGNNYTISDLYISRTSTWEVGLFTSLDTADINNVGLINVDISGNERVGALVGHIDANGLSTISNSYSTGNVSAEMSRVGGLVGYSENANIKNCYSSANTSGASNGGFTGNHDIGNISYCFSTGEISGPFGLSGFAYNNEDTIYNCFWDNQTSGQTTSDGGTGKNTSDMKTYSTFDDAGWDIGYTNVDLNDGYPYLAWQNGTSGYVWLINGTPPPDTTAPTPDPLTWSSEPDDDSSSAISMTATTASDDNTISYQFNETGGGSGATNSGWQSEDTTYTDSGLSENTQYIYKCRAKDSEGNIGNWSSTSSEYTACDAPTDAEVTIDSYGTNWIKVYVDECPNPAGGSTDCYIDCVSGGATDAGYTDTGRENSHYFYNFTGLSEGTEYCFKAKYRNGDGEATSLNSNSECQTTSVSNTAPTITGENPSNQSTDISLQPTVNVTVSDADGDTMDVTFASNTTITIGETGKVTTSNGDWKNITFQNSYSSTPVVIATPSTNNLSASYDDNGILPTINWVGKTGFNCTIYYDNGTTVATYDTPETLNYWVIDTDAISDYDWIDAGVHSVDAATTGDVSDSISFNKDVSGTPAVFLCPQTYSQGGSLPAVYWEAGTAGISGCSVYGGVHSADDDCSAGSGHEDVGWLAIDLSECSITSFESGSATISDSAWESFSHTATEPRVIVMQNSENGAQDPKYCQARDLYGTPDYRYNEQDGQDVANGHNGELVYWACLDSDDTNSDILIENNWVNYQTNSTVSDGSYSWDFTYVDSYDTKYWWKVYCDDGTDNRSEIYHFTTESESAIVWNTVSNTINGSYSNTTTWNTITDTINGSYSSVSTWNTITDTINGTYSNTTIWNTITDTINGSYSNTTTWNTITDTINGTYSAGTIWNTITSTINGSYSNNTNWKNIITTINGSYSNTTNWNTIIDTINGTYSSVSTWNTITDSINGTYTAGITWNTITNTINGSYSNTTTWTTISNTNNGSYSNTTNWKTITDTINGTYTAVTTWNTITSTINGSYSNTTIWNTIIDTINGSYSNTTSWVTITDTINGTYSNTTTWNTITDTINGTYSAGITWNTITSTINGSYSNTTNWETITNIINGSYSNATKWNIESNNINGTYTAGTTWNTITDTINGSYSSTSTWTTISNTINGSYSNNTTWKNIITTINGSYSNTTSWITISSNINGTYSNSTTWNTIIDTINGTYSSVSTWNTIIDTINGSYSSVSTWNTIIDTINGSYSNSTTWKNIITTINGSYSNTTNWNTISNTINGSYSSVTTWINIITTINGTYSNTTTWNTITNTINGTYSNTSSTPQLSNPNPANNSDNNPRTLTWNITINDNTGNITWNITCNNGQTNTGTNEGNGSKTLTLNNLDYDTNYTINVNATNTNHLWTNETFYFTTEPLIFGGDFNMNLNGQTATVTPTLGNAVEEYKWKIEDDINGETEWINATETENHHYILHPDTEYKITLFFKNQTLANQISKYLNTPNSKTMGVTTDEEIKNLNTTEETKQGRYRNVYENIPQWLKNIVKQNWIIFLLASTIFLAYLLLYRKPKKFLFIPIKKRKNKRRKK